MTAKFGESKRRAFLEAYARSGNVTLSAEQAGVSRHWVRLTRRDDPDFDSRCGAAKAASARLLSGGGRNRPPPGWERRSGVALAVHKAGRRPAQVVRSPNMVWTPRAEERFLGKLRQCNNLSLACEWAGMTLSSFEAHQRRWPDFRRRVSEAKAFAGQWLDVQREAAAAGPFEIEVTAEQEASVSIARRIRLARRHLRGRKG